MSQTSRGKSSGEIPIPIDRQMEDAKRLVASFRQKHNDAAAKRVLEWMAAQDIDDDDLTESVEWAKSQLPKSSTPEERRIQQQQFILRKAQVASATDLDEATQLLSKISESDYTKETQEFAAELSERRTALERFRKKLEVAVQQQNNAQAGQLIKGILEISPTDAVALSLKKKGIGGRNPSSETIQRRGSTSFWETHWKDAGFRKAAMMSAVLFFVMFTVTFSGVSYIKGLSKRPVKIEVNDNLATVLVDNQPVPVDAGVATTAVRPGTHSLKIQRDNEVVETRNFEVVRGQSPVLKVTFVGEPAKAGGLVVAAGNSPRPNSFQVPQGVQPASHEGKSSAGTPPATVATTPIAMPSRVISGVTASVTPASGAAPGAVATAPSATALPEAKSDVPLPNSPMAVNSERPGYTKVVLKGMVDDFILVTLRQGTVTYRRVSGTAGGAISITGKSGATVWDPEKDRVLRKNVIGAPVQFSDAIRHRMEGRATVDFHRYPRHLELHIRDGAPGAGPFEVEIHLRNKN